MLTLLLSAILSTSTASTAKATPDSIAGQSLSEVTVTAVRRDAIVTADKVSYTPSATLSGSGGSIYDTLSSLPGVTMAPKGIITVNGQRGVTVNIDGRKSVLTGDALLNYLKSLPASGVDRIEVLSAPSARNDASGAPTVINLVTRRISRQGFTLGIGGDGRLWRARRALGNLYAGYARAGHRLSLTYSGMAARNPSRLDIDRPYLNTSHRLTQGYDRQRNNIMHFASLAYDLTPASNLTLATTLTIDNYIRREHDCMTTAIPSLPSPAITDNHVRFNTRNIYGNVFVRRKSPTRPDTDMTLSFDFFNHHNSERQSMADNAATAIDGDMGGTTQGYVGAFDLRHAFTPQWHLSAGARCSYVTIDDSGRYTGNMQSDDIDALGSTFGYSENINAIYAEVRGKRGAFTATAGVRAEQANMHTRFSGNETAGHTDHFRHGLRLFPSLTFNLTTSEAGSWSLSYTERVNRPRYADLNPFIHIFDDITHVGGNIGLRESISRNLRLAWSRDAWLSVALTVSQTDGDIVKCYREITDRIVYVSPENLPRHMAASLTVSAVSLPVTRWWHLSATASLLYATYKFPQSTAIPSNTLFTPMGDVKNLFTMPYGFSAEISSSWRGRIPYGQAVVRAKGNVYIGIRKSLPRSVGSVTLYVRDLFNTNHTTSSIFLSGRKAAMCEREYEDMRHIGLSFSLRFNSGNARRHIKARDTWTDEMKRVNLQ